MWSSRVLGRFLKGAFFRGFFRLGNGVFACQVDMSSAASARAKVTKSSQEDQGLGKLLGAISWHLVWRWTSSRVHMYSRSQRGVCSYSTSTLSLHGKFRSNIIHNLFEPTIEHVRLKLGMKFKKLCHPITFVPITYTAHGGRTKLLSVQYR